MRAMNTLGEARVAAVSSTRCATRSRSSIVGLPQRTKTARAVLTRSQAMSFDRRAGARRAC